MINDLFHSPIIIFIWFTVISWLLYRLYFIKKIIFTKFLEVLYFCRQILVKNCIYKYTSLLYFYIERKLNRRNEVTCEDILQKSKINIDTELEIINEIQIVNTSKFKNINSKEGFFLFNKKQNRKKL
jgi:hypothetical protein